MPRLGGAWTDAAKPTTHVAFIDPEQFGGAMQAPHV